MTKYVVIARNSKRYVATFDTMEEAEVFMLRMYDVYGTTRGYYAFREVDE